MVARITIPNLDGVIGRYQNGTTLTLLSSELGVTRNTLRRMFRDADIQTRTLSDVARLRKQRTSRKLEPVKLDESGQKICSRCRTTKPTAAFYRSKSKSDGLECWCRQCCYQYRKTRIASKGQGLCPACLKNPPQPDLRLCTDCQKLQVKRQLRRRQKFTEQGLCNQCGKVPPLPTLTENRSPLCEMCYLKVAASNALKSYSLWEGLREKLITQNFTCPYSGKLLVLGVNASVDHIMPVSRFPQLRSSLDNVEWVDLQVNRMKRDLTRNEFLALASQIVNNRSSQPSL